MAWISFLLPVRAGKYSSLHRHVQTNTGAYPTSYPIGTRLKRTEREGDHSQLVRLLRIPGAWRTIDTWLRLSNGGRNKQKWMK